jgi:phosphatidylglycerophosphate synthase
MSERVLTRVADVYRRSSKPKDILWNRFVARPLASVLVASLAKTRVTPNQVTFASFAVFVAAAALLVVYPGHAGLLAAVAVMELSYVLDCADGQLARLQASHTPVGAHLDFLMDEVKAFLLVAAVGVRLWLAEGEARWLFEAVVGLAAVASAISLTGFMRRQEYRDAAVAGGDPAPAAGAGDYGQGFPGGTPPENTHAVPDSPPFGGRGSLAFSTLRGGVRLAETVGRFLVHYPSYMVLVALADGLGYFLHMYVAVNALYVGRALTQIVRTLGSRR